GFIGKLSLLQGAIISGHWQIGAVSLIVSFFALMAMLRLWQKAFWGEPVPPTHLSSPTTSQLSVKLMLTPIALLLALSLVIGIFSDPAFRWSEVAAYQVLDRQGYISAVAPTNVIEYSGAVDEN